MSKSRMGTTIEMIRNRRGIFQGDLVAYAQLLCKAPNIRHPYHNLRHMLHVSWMCYQACLFYSDLLTRRQRRNLIVAGMFHDYGHSGMAGYDDLNIERAIRGLRKHAVLLDRSFVDDIEAIIRPSEYPYQVDSLQLPLSAQILRDADKSQGLSDVWIQQVAVGLSAELGIPLVDVFRMQEPFLRKLGLTTEWAKYQFTLQMIEDKIEEGNDWVAILEEPV